MKNNVFPTGLLAAAVAAVCVLSSAADDACAPDKPSHATLIAHRGESEDAPENTLPAYKLAVDRGFGFECDVYLSKDGRVFTFHDGTLTRTTAGANTNRCGDVTWDELSALDVGGWGKWKGSAFAGTRPALLEEVLELARDGRRIYIEVKTGPEIVPHIKKVFAAQSRATPGNVLFISFNEATCKALKRDMPEYKVYLLMCARKRKGVSTCFVTAEDAVAALRETESDGLDFQYDPAVATAEFVKAVRDAGFEFHVWTIDRLDAAMEAFGRGAMTVTTNRAGKLLEEFGP